MSKTPVTPFAKSPLLQMPRVEAHRRLREQIEQGVSLRCETTIERRDQVGHAQSRVSAWDANNRQVLCEILDDASTWLAECDLHGPRLWQVDISPRQALDLFRGEVDERLRVLRSFQERLATL